MSVSREKQKNGLIRLFSDYARIQIISFFLENPDYPFGGTQIDEMTDISRKTFYNERQELLEIGIIKESDEDGKYELRKEHPLTPLLQAIYNFDEPSKWQ